MREGDDARSVQTVRVQAQRDSLAHKVVRLVGIRPCPSPASLHQLVRTPNAALLMTRCKYKTVSILGPTFPECSADVAGTDNSNIHCTELLIGEGPE